MRFDFDGKRLTVTGKNLAVTTVGSETVIYETEPSAAAAPAATGAKRGRKSNAEKAAASTPQTSFNPEQFPAQ